jgi:hypothetical protein
MKLRLLVSCLAVALGTTAAHAQVGLYFNPVVSRVSNSKPDSGPFAFLGQNGTSATFGGVDFGAYYNFSHSTKFDVGVDVRDAIQHANNGSLNSFLVGLKLQAEPLAHGLKPYVQLSVGEGRTKAPLSPVHVSKLEYDVFGGVDRALGRHVDWRVVEVGYGSVTTIGSDTFNSGSPIPSAKLLTFSTGFVFRFP